MGSPMIAMRMGKQPDTRITMRNVIKNRDLAVTVLLEFLHSQRFFTLAAFIVLLVAGLVVDDAFLGQEVAKPLDQPVAHTVCQSHVTGILARFVRVVAQGKTDVPSDIVD